MTGLPLLTRDQLDLVLLVCEYLRLCAVRGHPVGTSLAQLLEHEWRQGAQAPHRVASRFGGMVASAIRSNAASSTAHQ